MIRERGGDALFIKADVTKTEDVGEMIEGAVAPLGRALI
jgi:hypothetical protein